MKLCDLRLTSNSHSQRGRLGRVDSWDSHDRSHHGTGGGADEGGHCCCLFKSGEDPDSMQSKRRPASEISSVVKRLVDVLGCRSMV